MIKNGRLADKFIKCNWKLKLFKKLKKLFHNHENCLKYDEIARIFIETSEIEKTLIKLYNIHQKLSKIEETLFKNQGKFWILFEISEEIHKNIEYLSLNFKISKRLKKFFHVPWKLSNIRDKCLNFCWVIIENRVILIKCW